MAEKELISVSEAAQIMGISRVAVFKKIKKGEIEAEKIGRNYVVNRKSLGSIYQELTSAQKRAVENAIEKVFRDYSEALKKLGKE